MTPRERFLGLLKNDILKLDLAELNFGVYRILNARRDLVLKFLDHELPALIETQLAQLPGAATEDEESRIYAALDTFFHRYWDDGDFILRPRRGRNAAYSVPYDGSDVYFHWATKGSHYVKSGEFLKTYAFKPEGVGGEVRFEVAAAQQEKDNVKGAKRYFVPAGKAQDGATLVFRFEFRPLTETEARNYDLKGGKAKSADNNASDENGGGQLAPSKVQDRLLRAWLAGADFKSAAVSATLRGAAFDKHVARYVRRQTSDFFVHPQLGPFLEGELDYFLKNEFLQLWDRETPEALARERAKFNIVRGIGQRIIAFLHQIEDFQARLFEKRKFILKTDWLVMASALAAREGGQALVQKATTSRKQITEWKQWVGDDSPLPAKDGAALKAAGTKLLDQYPHLPIHTAHFDEAFVLDVLGCFEDIDAELGGVLIHGENFAAMRTLTCGFAESIKNIYIDPPYNTGADDFLYRDSFFHGSWLTMLAQRVGLLASLLRSDGSLFISLDDSEAHNARHLLDETLGASARIATFARKRRMASGMKEEPVSPDHEFVFAYGKPAGKPDLMGFGIDEGDYPFEDKISKYRSTDLTIGMGRTQRPNQYFAIVDPDSGNSYFPPASRVWRFEPKSMVREIAKKNIIWPDSDSGKKILRPRYKTRYVAEGEHASWRPASTWMSREDDTRAGTRRGYRGGLNQEGTRELLALFQNPPQIYPKPTSLVEDVFHIGNSADGICADVFAGSGTTAHATINLNRQDNHRRRFLLIEQGEYFDTLLLPRIAKIISCPEWRDGKPKPDVTHAAKDNDHWSRRTLPLVKILRIERYEDSLDALETRDEYDARRAGMREMAGADYTLRYLLEEETRGSALFAPGRLFEAPFAAQLPVHTPGGIKLVPIDLAESTLAMLGLRLVRVFEDHFEKRRYRFMSARTRDDELQLVVLRDLPSAPEDKFWENEYRWLAKTIEARWGRKLAAYARVWYNGDTLLLDNEAGASIDAEFARVMQERDPHAAAG